jgi:DNA-binding transcriptional ArsR family regulator
MEWCEVYRNDPPQRFEGAALAAKGKTPKRKSSRSKRKAGLNLETVKALAHELRVEILTILNERMASPNELSKELGEGLSQVSYHVKVLKDYGCITQVKTVPRRGAVEHYYRATSRPYINARDWEKLPSSVREGMSADMLQMVIDDVAAALEAGTVDAHKDRHLSRTLLHLDEKGLKDVGKILSDALDRIVKVQSDSTGRLTKSGEEGIDAMVALMGIETPSARPKKASAKGKAKAGGKAKRK